MRWIISFLGLLSLDLITKWLGSLYLKTPVAIIPKFLELKLSVNPGIAFSIPIPNLVMIILTPVFLILIVWLITKSCNLKKTLTKISLILILTGGIGNFVNRIVTGGVIDMIAFSFWPSFNLADSYLTIGTFLLIVFYGKIQITHDRRN